MPSLGGQWGEGDEVFRKFLRRILSEHIQETAGFCNQIRNGHGKLMAPAELIQQHGLAGVIRECIPPRHFDEKGKAVGKRGIKRLRPVVDRFRFRLLVGRRIHRRPAVAEFFQSDALDAPFVNDREEFVLKLGAGPADLVDEDDLRFPYR